MASDCTTFPYGSLASLLAFVEDAIESGSVVHTDQWEGYERADAAKRYSLAKNCRVRSEAESKSDPRDRGKAQALLKLPSR